MMKNSNRKDGSNQKGQRIVIEYGDINLLQNDLKESNRIRITIYDIFWGKDLIIIGPACNPDESNLLESKYLILRGVTMINNEDGRIYQTIREIFTELTKLPLWSNLTITIRISNSDRRKILAMSS